MSDLSGLCKKESVMKVLIVWGNYVMLVQLIQPWKKPYTREDCCREWTPLDLVNLYSLAWLAIFAFMLIFGTQKEGPLKSLIPGDFFFLEFNAMQRIEGIAWLPTILLLRGHYALVWLFHCWHSMACPLTFVRHAISAYISWRIRKASRMPCQT